MCFGALDKMSKRFENILTGHEWAGNWRDILLAGNGLGMDCEQKNALLEADNLAVRFYTFATGRLREARRVAAKVPTKTPFAYPRTRGINVKSRAGN